MKSMRLCLTLVLMLLVTARALAADPLLLSDADMQKLKHYFPNQQTQQLVWKGEPLAIQLPLNKEKRLIFPEHVTVDMKGALSTQQVRVYNDDKSLYLTALQPFAATRIFVTPQSGHEVILIDLSANNSASANTVNIALNNNQQTTESVNNTVTTTTTRPLVAQNSSDNTQPTGDGYVTLLHFAWQQLFAPQRLLKNPYGITRAMMHTEPLLSTLIYGDKVYAHPEVSWFYDNTYITAVELRNKYTHPTTLHLSRDVCGNWLAASVYPSRFLKPAGQKPGDSAVLFLISSKPFGDSMEVCNGAA